VFYSTLKGVVQPFGPELVFVEGEATIDASKGAGYVTAKAKA
jgi:hypothetical protein